MKLKETLESVPRQNLEIYALLFQLEVGLREYLIETLEASFGSRWWKGRLPPDVKSKFLKGREYERGFPWSRLIPHHPIYYVDFPDLKKIIERRDNWQDVFQPIFRTKETLTGPLTALEPIRNNVAHNRLTTSADLDIVKGALATLVSALGRELFDRLVTRCTSAEEIPRTLQRLTEEAQLAFRQCERIGDLPVLTTWNRVSHAWWFDDEYLTEDLGPIREYFDSLGEYSSLPRRRGVGHTIEKWLESAMLAEKHDKARELLCRVVGDI